MIKRYDVENVITRIGVYKEMVENERGDYVLYDDIKHLLERSDNSEYTASPKLPSVGDVMKFNPSLNYDDVQETLHAIYHLGNFS